MPADAWATSARVLLRGLAALSFLLAAFPAVAWAEPVRFGLWPYHSPTYLARYYEDLARHFKAGLGREVIMETAPSVQVFIQRLVGGRYDIVILGPHFARLAQIEHGWQPVAGYIGSNPVYLVSRKQGDIRKAVDLKGKTVATHDRALLLSLTAKKWLKSQGLADGDYRWLEIGGLANSVHSLVAGEADAAVTTLASLSMSPQAELDQLHIVGEAGSNPQLYIFASPSLKKSELQSLRKASKEFMQNGSYVLADISNRELRSMDGFAMEIRHYFRMAREGERP